MILDYKKTFKVEFLNFNIIKILYILHCSLFIKISLFNDSSTLWYNNKNLS